MRRTSGMALAAALGCAVVMAATALIVVAQAVTAQAATAQAVAAKPAPTLTATAPTVQGSTITTYCLPCHTDRRRSGGVSLAAFDLDHPASDADTAERVVRKLRGGMMPPPGAPQPPPGVVTALAETLERSLDAAARAGIDPGSRPFARLTRAEYAAAVFDLVGVTVDATAWLPADTISAGFDNVADVQTFSPILVTGYLRAATQVSAAAVAATGGHQVFVCRPRAPADEAACARRIVTALATRAYRGQAEAADIDDALAFFATGRGRGTFDQGVQLALRSILVSPKFLFRFEPVLSAAAVRPVGPLALASRLSYFIWGRAPDRALLRAAAAGLDRPGALDAQLRRLLADPRASALATRFARQWLRLQALDDIVPSAAVAPAFDRALIASMQRETELFFANLVRDDRSVLDLLTADYTFVDRRLARHYGLPEVRAAGFVRVTLPPERRGLLGHASVLMSTSLADRTSPVLRGKWVMEVLLGTPPPPPPPNVPALDDTAPVARLGARPTTRQRIESHRRNPQCASCHRAIDPLGLTLEGFDAVGARRTAEGGVPVDTRGELLDGTIVDGPAGLQQALLARQDLVLRAFTENLMTYALGRRLTAADMPVVRSIVAAAARDGYRMSSFIRGVAMSAPFTLTSSPR